MPFSRCFLAILATLIASALLAGPAQALEYVVNSTGDQPDASPGDQVCDSDTQGCTLRAAIDEARSDDNFLDNTIRVPPGTYNVSSALTPGFTTHILGTSARSTVIRRTPGAGTTRVFEIDFATVDISGVTIRDGRADSSNNFFGGNIRAQNSTVTISNSTITGGHGASGAGISNVRGSLTVRSSTIAANAADIPFEGNDGGAIQNFGESVDPATLTLENTTITGNSARLAGGIISGGNPGNSVEIKNSTIASNASGDRGAGGGLFLSDGIATVQNSIIALNTSSATPLTPNCSRGSGTSMVSAGSNLEGGSECGFTSAGDLQGTDPKLGPLQNAGGSTDTRPLLAGSPAIDAGSATCLPTDQRGVPRPQGPRCDIGAYEVAVAAAAPPDTVIVSGPSFVTRDRTPTFTFSSSDPGAGFECSLDGGPFVPCSSPFTPVAPLGAGVHTFQVRARDGAGNVDPSPAVLAFSIPAELKDLPPPVIGKTVNAEPVSGSVTVAVPARSGAAGARAAQKGLRFIPLREARQVPVGSFFNTRRGRVRLQSATSRRGRRQAGVFSSGLFQTFQSRRRRAKGLFELRLKGSSFGSCARAGHRKKASAARHGKRRIRRVRGNARGRFGTRGRHSSATVRGTIWEVTDRCDGTLTKVSRGKVAVRDFRRRKTVLVRAGKSYLARARR